MVDKHVWEGAIGVDREFETLALYTDKWEDDGECLWMAEEFSNAGLDRKRVRITVEVLD